MLEPEPVNAGDRRDVDHNAIAAFPQQRRESADHREWSAHIGDQHAVEQRVVERLKIAMRHRLGETGRVHQNVGAAEGAADVVGGLSHGGRVFEHDPHRAMAVTGKLAMIACARSAP